MKKIFFDAIIALCTLCCITSCETDIEALDIVVPDEPSDEYYANLRAYKATMKDREIWFGWFGGWKANSASMMTYLDSAPDSCYIISIWGDYQNLSEAQLKDLRHVQQMKGTKVTYTIFAHEIPEEFMGGENKDQVTQEGINAYVKSLIDVMNQYGYDGIDLDYEPGFGGSGPLVSWPGHYENMEMFVKALGKYIGPKSGTGKLLIIDGVPFHLKEGLHEYFDYGVVQAYSSWGYADLQSRFDNAAANGWTPEKYIFAETFEGGHYIQGGPCMHTLRDGTQVPSLEGMARFLPMYKGKLAKRKGGCGTYHMENDYQSTPNYKWTRNAIRIMDERNNSNK